MRNGASDYLQKSHLARLVPALLHAVDAAETKRARDKADRDLVDSKQRLHELAQHLQTSIEHERAAIAREIHDDVGGSLTALKFDLAWIARHSSAPQVVSRVQSALETVSHAVEASQRIMHNLRPAILEQGLAAALHWITLRFERRAGVVCTIRLPKKPLDLPPGVPLVAYRTAQEALTNISKHAQATRVQIDLSMAGGVLSLEISDNGRGLSQEDLAKARSFRHSRPARAGDDGRGLDRPVERAAWHDPDSFGAARCCRQRLCARRRTGSFVRSQSVGGCMRTRCACSSERDQAGGGLARAGSAHACIAAGRVNRPANARAQRDH